MRYYCSHINKLQGVFVLKARKSVTFHGVERKTGRTDGTGGRGTMGGQRTQAVSSRIIQSGKFHKMTGYS